MAQRSKKGTGVNKALEMAINAELKEITRKDADGKFVYALIDRMRVVDRGLKLEAIKQKLDDPGFGTGFHDDATDD